MSKKNKIQQAKRIIQALKTRIKLTPFDPYVRRCKIVNVVDGDTVDCVIDMGYQMFSTHRIRLLGVDTPELRAKDAKERDAAAAAKYFVIAWSGNRIVDEVEQDYTFTIQSQKADSFGRWLGEIKNEKGESLSQALIEAGHGEVYEK